jgi:hypothetical protein
MAELAGIDDFLTCARFVRGTVTLMEKFGVSTLFKGLDCLTDPGVLTGENPMVMSNPADDLIALSQLYIACNAEPCAETALTYHEAIQLLHEQFTLLHAIARNESSQSPIFVALTWPAAVSAHYLALLEEKKPLAILILAYYGALLHRVDFFWCFEGWGRHLVKSSVSSLGNSYDEFMTWPKTAVGLCL